MPTSGITTATTWVRATFLRATLASPLPTRAGGGHGGGSGGGSSHSSGGGFSGGSGSGIHFGSGSGSSTSGGLIGFVAIAIILVVLFVVVKAVRARTGGGGAGAAMGLTGAVGAAISTVENFGQAGYGAGNFGSPTPPPPGMPTPVTGRATSQAEIAAGVAQITAHDPGFSMDNLLGQVDQAFFEVQQAWVERKPELSRAVMADGCWSQHHMQIAQYLSENRMNRLDNLAIQSTVPVAVTTDGTTDRVIARFFASSADFDIDLATQKVVRGHTDDENWCEDWVFERKASATTRPDGGTLSKKCPNCGAPLNLAVDGSCSYCQAMVMSGELDWVLERIDQLPSWEWAMANLPR